MHFSVRTVFHGDRVENSFNMVISGMKQNFTPNVWKANMSGLQIGTSFFLRRLQKMDILNLNPFLAVTCYMELQ